MKSSMLYRVAAVLLLLFAIGHTLGFRQSDPAWGVDALYAPCGRFTLTCKDSTPRIGTSFWPPDFLSAYFSYSRRSWHGSWVAFRQRLWGECAASRGRSPFALRQSRL